MVGQAGAGQDDVNRAVAANDSFHTEIALVAGNAVLAELAGIVSRRVQWYYGWAPRSASTARGPSTLIWSTR